MATTTREPSEPSIDISPLRPDGVWQFFYDIRDVTNLNPAEEQEEPWEATIDSERVGMAVVDTFPTDTAFVSRLAVKPAHREQGVGAAILQALIDEYGHISCRVHETNDAGEALVRSVGLVEEESRFRRLKRFESPGGE